MKSYFDVYCTLDDTENNGVKYPLVEVAELFGYTLDKLADNKYFELDSLLCDCVEDAFNLGVKFAINFFTNNL